MTCRVLVSSFVFFFSNSIVNFFVSFDRLWAQQRDRALLRIATLQ